MDREDWIVSLAFRNLVSIDKLEQLGEKFLDWKFDIKMILEALNLWEAPNLWPKTICSTLRGRRGARAFRFWSQSVLSWKYPSDPTWVRRVRRRDAETCCSVSCANFHTGQAVYGVELPSVREVVHGAERPLGKTPQVPPLPN